MIPSCQYKHITQDYLVAYLIHITEYIFFLWYAFPLTNLTISFDESSGLPLETLWCTYTSIILCALWCQPFLASCWMFMMAAIAHRCARTERKFVTFVGKICTENNSHYFHRLNLNIITLFSLYLNYLNILLCQFLQLSIISPECFLLHFSRR